jgi:hypothetical protein
MNDAERKARGERAKTYRDEFLVPILAESRDTYQARIIEVATTELDPKVRAEKLTALSIAVRILGNIESGLDAFVNDGAIAANSLLKAEKVEKMGRHERRLLDMVPRL